MSDWWGILWLVVLLAANAFFVGAEFAVLAARRAQIEPKAQAGNGAAKTALWAMEHATLMLACSQLGITVCSLLILNVSEPSIHHLLAGPLERLGLSTGVTDVASFVVALLIVSFLHVTFGEMVPKNLSFSRPDSSVLVLAPPLVFLGRLVAPVIGMLDGTANFILRRFGVEPRSEASSTYTLDQVATIVAESKRAGMLSDDSGTLTNAFEFTTKKAGDLLVGLDDLVTLPVDVSPRRVEEAVGTYGHSRYVLVDQGTMQGYLHFKDVIAVSGDALDRPVPARSIRRMAVVPADAEAEDVLSRMRRTGAHLATVQDEAGVVQGVLFLEDIVEELIGEVHDASGRMTA
ncbi:MAG TPA: hemolysin family protein [Trueperaceae bacterium]|nr:hemolysin family protein [Trueperaceae bacterium]